MTPAWPLLVLMEGMWWSCSLQTRKVDKSVALEKLNKAISAGKDRKDTWIALAQVSDRQAAEEQRS